MAIILSGAGLAQVLIQRNPEFDMRLISAFISTRSISLASIMCLVPISDLQKYFCPGERLIDLGLGHCRDDLLRFHIDT